MASSLPEPPIENMACVANLSSFVNALPSEVEAQRSFGKALEALLKVHATDIPEPVRDYLSNRQEVQIAEIDGHVVFYRVDRGLCLSSPIPKKRFVDYVGDVIDSTRIFRDQEVDTIVDWLNKQEGK